MINLYDYQRDAVTAAHRSLRRKRNPLVIAPTGTGKTVISGEIIRRFCGKKRRALIVVGRDVLLGQHADTLARLGLYADIEQGDRHASARAQVVIASAQTISRPAREMDPDAFALALFDEAHHTPAPTWKRIATHYRCPRVGFTATADRADGKALGEVFDEIAYEMDMLTATETGLVVPLVQRIVTVDELDISRVKIRSAHGDLDQGELSNLLTKIKALQGVAVPLLDHAGTRRTLAFAVTIEHAVALAEQLNRIRPGAARATWGEDPQRHEALAAFRRGDFQILVNVDLLREGFDDPEVSCVAMARPTASRLLYAQSVGRGTRLHASKSDCLVMDFVGNAERHDLMTSFDLFATEKDKPEVLRAAKDVAVMEPDVAAHVAMKRARELPADVLSGYSIRDVQIRHAACKQCGETFRPSYAGRKFCSSKCASACRAAGAIKATTIECGNCGKGFNPRDSVSKYCSRECQWSARRVAARKCEVCNGVIRRKAKRFCSHACQGVASKTIEPRRCQCCDVSFVPKDDCIKYCSRECVSKSQRVPRPPCLVCGAPVKNHIFRTCSRQCRGKARRAGLSA